MVNNGPYRNPSSLDFGSVTIGIPTISPAPPSPEMAEIQEHANIVQKRVADVLTENDALQRRVAQLEGAIRDLTSNAHQQLRIIEDQIKQGLDRDELR